MLREVILSQPNLPLWVRGLAAVLALVASWWLMHTETIHGILGDSVAALSLGVVAVFVLRGMHQPLGLWPDRNVRGGFSVQWGLVAAAAAALLIGVSGASDAVSAAVRTLLRTDIGLMLLVTVGTVAWTLALGQVRQQPYLRWYAIAAVCAVAGPLVAVLFGGRGGLRVSGADGTLGLFGFLFWSVAHTSRVLVTEELAFRRLLIGRPEAAGVVLILISALVSALWAPLVREGASFVGLDALNALLVGIIAGCLYVLARSLLVAALFHGLYSAVVVSSIGATVDTGTGSSVAMVFVTGAIGVTMLVVVLRQRGWVRQRQTAGGAGCC